MAHPRWMGLERILRECSLGNSECATPCGAVLDGEGASLQLSQHLPKCCRILPQRPELGLETDFALACLGRPFAEAHGHAVELRVKLADNLLRRGSGLLQLGA